MAPQSPLEWLFNTVVDFYLMLVFVYVIMSWLTALNVVNTRNRFVYLVGDFLYRITEPGLRPIRRMMPNLGGIDLSPVVLIIGLIFLQRLVNRYVF